jgi:hypothetical protein
MRRTAGREFSKGGDPERGSRHRILQELKDLGSITHSLPRHGTEPTRYRPLIPRGPEPGAGLRPLLPFSSPPRLRHEPCEGGEDGGFLRHGTSLRCLSPLLLRHRPRGCRRYPLQLPDDPFQCQPGPRKLQHRPGQLRHSRREGRRAIRRSPEARGGDGEAIGGDSLGIREDSEVVREGSVAIRRGRVPKREGAVPGGVGAAVYRVGPVARFGGRDGSSLRASRPPRGAPRAPRGAQLHLVRPGAPPEGTSSDPRGRQDTGAGESEATAPRCEAQRSSSRCRHPV